jgi:hypothetical protein
MQVHQEMRTFPVRAIGLAVALLLAVLLAGAAGYALRGFGYSSPTTVSAPAATEEQSPALPAELTSPMGPTDADAIGPWSQSAEAAPAAGDRVPTHGLLP